MKQQEVYWHQRSRLHWAILGDRNTKFYHATAISRKRRGQIRTIQAPDGSWEVEEKRIRGLFVDHFKKIYEKTPTVPIDQVYERAVLHGINGLPESAHESLSALPSEQEVYRALMTLGPNKSAGPDGINASLIQQQWASFKPAVLAQVKEFFETCHMPSNISRSNLILIPKIEDPVKVTDFRPISVCNIIYKIISKILTLRLKPYIALCISKSQCAFLPGREISESIILFREVLHSFNQSGYRNKEFCLKVDLAKAFDKMDWDYIAQILHIYNLPQKFANWVMSCIKSAEFSIILNGRGDGFIKPRSGLRQGCSLSPYVFILGMDLLSRKMQFLVNSGSLRGVKIAPTAPSITNCLYADDLLIFGAAR